MEETYEGRLRRLAEGVPERPCVVALVPTIDPEEAAALANDLARSVGAGRGGHTLLMSFETAPARLDHEIGLEEGPGLTDVLSGRAAMREVAAPGR
ncbi:MAG: hypothetical protein R3266_02560, partial [Gemmatimonadota bacterium]|nr:hypothetical protein [Gemmatimonadota bacterium]